MIRIYNGSKGPILIAEMNTHHLRAATLKQERENPGTEQTRALRDELNRRNEAYREAQEREKNAECW